MTISTPLFLPYSAIGRVLDLHRLFLPGGVAEIPVRPSAVNRIVRTLAGAKLVEEEPGRAGIVGKDLDFRLLGGREAPVARLDGDRGRPGMDARHEHGVPAYAGRHPSTLKQILTGPTSARHSLVMHPEPRSTQSLAPSVVNVDADTHFRPSIAASTGSGRAYVRTATASSRANRVVLVIMLILLSKGWARSLARRVEPRLGRASSNGISSPRRIHKARERNRAVSFELN